MCPIAGDEARVYELIVRHFLACVSQDALGKETTVNIDINGEAVRTKSLNNSILMRDYEYELSFEDSVS